MSMIRRLFDFVKEEEERKTIGQNQVIYASHFFTCSAIIISVSSLCILCVSILLFAQI